MPNFLSQFRLVYMCLKNKSQRMRMRIQDICFLRFFTDINSPLWIRYLQYKNNNLFCLTSISRYSPIGTMFPLSILLSCNDSCSVGTLQLVSCFWCVGRSWTSRTLGWWWSAWGSTCWRSSSASSSMPSSHSPSSTSLPPGRTPSSYSAEFSRHLSLHSEQDPGITTPVCC